MKVSSSDEGATLGLVTRLADDPVEVTLHMAREIAGRSPHAVRGAKTLIGSPNQVEAITTNFEKREPRVGGGGRAEGDLARDWVRHA